MKAGGGLLAFVCAAVAMAWPTAASAFELKHTGGGSVVRWNEPNVSFVVDPSVSGISGGGQGVDDAVAAWSGASGAPTLSTSPGSEPSKGPAVDGQNTILFAPHGYEPAGKALAITILTFDNTSGQIVDADVVINGKYKFAELAPDTHAPAGAVAFSTEGVGGDDDRQSGAFDVQHVLAHEVGHALGLADEHENHGAMMYAYSVPGDSTLRGPTSDDLDGLDQAYGGSQARSGGCGQGNIGGRRTGGGDVWTFLAIFAIAGAWRYSKRGARIAVPAFAAFAALLGAPARAQSAPLTSSLLGDATARVVVSTTEDVGGVFVTTLELRPSTCRASSCPERATARVWGGTVGRITQQVGDQPVPRTGDEVEVSFSRQGLVELSDRVEASVLPGRGL